MPGPKIAIVGSADPNRTYDPALDVEEVRQMARELGRELAAQQCRIVVYDQTFIEADVVAGLVEAKPSEDKAIIVRYPQRKGSLPFPEEKDYPKLFDRRPDASDDWEVSFYRSLADSDGVVLLGGGASAMIAGQVAIGSRLPIVAIAASGGAAARAWKTLSPGEDLPTHEEHTAMGNPWSNGSAGACVKGLLDQHRRRHAMETGPIRAHALIAVTMFIASIAAAVWSGVVGWLPLLYASTLLGGGAGATIRTVFERRYGTTPTVPPSVIVTLALGMVAGGVAGMLYLGAQPGSITLKGEAAVRLVSFVAVVSVIGGLTADAVYRKLLGLDVVQSRSLASQDAAAQKKL